MNSIKPDDDEETIHQISINNFTKKDDVNFDSELLEFCRCFCCLCLIFTDLPEKCCLWIIKKN